MVKERREAMQSFSASAKAEICRVIFGSSAFLIPSMGLIALLLLLTRRKEATV